MKKLLAALSALALFLSLTACGEDTAETQPTEAATQATVAQTVAPTETTAPEPEAAVSEEAFLKFYNTYLTARNVETLRTISTEDTTDESLQTIAEDNSIRKKEHPERFIPMDTVELAQIVDQFDGYQVIRFRLSSCDSDLVIGNTFIAVQLVEDRYISNFNYEFVQEIKDHYYECDDCNGTGICTVLSKKPCQHCNIADSMSHRSTDYQIMLLTNTDNVTGGEQFVVPNMPDGSTEPTTGSTEPTTGTEPAETTPAEPSPNCPYCLDTGYGTEEEDCLSCDGKGYYCLR